MHPDLRLLAGITYLRTARWFTAVIGMALVASAIL
jgi:hypothetical protein